MTQHNPLLDLSGVPRYTAIRPEHIKPAVEARIAEVDRVVERLVGEGGEAQDRPTWAGFVRPLEDALEGLERAWGPVEHLNAVMNTPALREVYRETKPLLAEHAAKLQQDPRLFRAYEQVLAQADDEGLDAAQRHVLLDAIRDFKLAGVDLPPEKKDRFRAIQVELSQLSSRFQDHLIDENRDYRLVIEDPKDVEGLPPSAVEAARAQALDDDPQAPERRWSFTLHVPSFLPFMQYQRNRALRQELHKAYVTRATTGERDNAELVERILELRKELAELLGYANYAEVSVATKMAESPAQVHAFLSDLAERALPAGRADRDELAAFAKEKDGLEQLEAWDVGFYREALRQERFSFSDEEVRAYFPLDRVLNGLFKTLERLYGIRLQDRTGELALDLWHPDVRALEVREESGEVRGYMLLDLFARDGKRQGAWMGDCIQRKRKGDGELQLPVAYLVCNFSRPLEGKASLLRHGDVRTLFHECGHALHHVLSRVDIRQASGINNVPWDGVELPSQFHENWVWQPESLAELSSHVETGEPLPEDLVERMLAARNFHKGSFMLRQLEFGLFDLELHTDYVPGEGRSAHDVLESVRDRVSLVRPPAYDRFECGFTHIFAGGYAAGYYSYAWAEVLAADAFSRFEEEGIYSRQAGQDFLHHVLEKGGSDDLMKLYVAFRGREPSPEALLRQSGLLS